MARFLPTDGGRGVGAPRTNRRVLAAVAAVALVLSGCQSAELDLFDERGPHAVGVTTLEANGLAIEVWYPVDRSTVEGGQIEVFDSRSAWPPDIRDELPEELFPPIDTGAHRDATPSPLGPFPIVVFSHGFGGYRQFSTWYTSHIASWGFVVAAPDHPGRDLTAVVAGTARRSSDLDVGDVVAVISALDGIPKGAPLDGVPDNTRVAVAGYSAGGATAVAAARLDDVDTFIALSGRAGVTHDNEQKPALVISAEKDTMVSPLASEQIFDRLKGPKRLVSIADGGHSALVDLCPTWYDHSGSLSSLTEWLGSVNGIANGCAPGFPRPEAVWQLVNHVSVAHLYEVFGLGPTSGSFDESVLNASFDVVTADYRTSG